MVALQCYAFLWLAMTGYNSFLLVAPGKRRKQLDEMIESSHIYETMMAGVSQRIFLGFFVGIELLMITFESAGLAMVYAYVPLHGYFLAAFAVILAAHIMQSVINLVRVKTLSRIFSKGRHPFALLARYLRLLMNNPSPLMCLATYGKCLAAVQLFLHLLRE